MGFTGHKHGCNLHIWVTCVSCSILERKAVTTCVMDLESSRVNPRHASMLARTLLTSCPLTLPDQSMPWEAQTQQLGANPLCPQLGREGSEYLLNNNINYKKWLLHFKETLQWRWGWRGAFLTASSTHSVIMSLPLGIPRKAKILARWFVSDSSALRKVWFGNSHGMKDISWICYASSDSLKEIFVFILPYPSAYSKKVLNPFFNGG